MNPLVSIVVPTYNNPALLLETLTSILAQTFTDYELIVVNDGSTDDTAARLAPYRDRIRLITQANQGIGGARNRGLDEARGKYVALCDHDDLWMPTKLEQQTTFYERHPECSVVGVPFAVTDNPAAPYFSVDQYGDQVIADSLRAFEQGDGLFCSSTMMFNRERAAGLRYGTRRMCTEDQGFQLQLLGRGPMGIAGKEILVLYRRHEGNYSRQAEYHYNGIFFLRELQRRGEFRELEGQSHALRLYLARLARNATLGQITAGYRSRALRLYRAEFRDQLALGRFSFLAALPLLMCLPHSMAVAALAKLTGDLRNTGH